LHDACTISFYSYLLPVPPPFSINLHLLLGSIPTFCPFRSPPRRFSFEFPFGPLFLERGLLARQIQQFMALKRIIATDGNFAN
jgi:hypothetical protein